MTSSRTSAVILTGLIIIAGTFALVAWAPWSSEGATTTTSTWTPVDRALCTAARDADADRTAAARRVFYDDAHDPLHDLARLAAVEHRDVAATLLRAKEKVETLLDTPTNALATQLRRLARATRDAAAAIGESVDASCTEPR